MKKSELYLICSSRLFLVRSVMSNKGQKVGFKFFLFYGVGLELWGRKGKGYNGVWKEEKEGMAQEKSKGRDVTGKEERQ